ncbi:transcriptional regulator, AraC family [Paenibacillus curdlanolyticus YK9]|uniref:Transcriptional regulator, AraC family n=1 Tax=Paenibacillus curdlanolyticus YK9 TaxID=717606 RepID=E0IES8_9BACL|nr:AraC family transcriptional regulator [Paenibacillus curdlanolyticus]EFM09166.1 transcriptional regulator, AraC family [Paenibacillus curdlanolyticus YK9]
MPDTPIIASSSFGSSSIKLSGWRDVSPQEAFEPALSDHLIVIHTTPKAVRVLEKADGYHQEGVAKPNDINIFSAGDMSFCRWEEDLSFLRLDLPPSLIEKVSNELELASRGADVDFGRHIRLGDERVVQLARWLFEDLNNGSSGQIYVDSLIHMLVVHLLQQYGTASVKQSASPQQLARSQIDRALDFIHEMLEQDIALEDIAAAANVSPSHLVRLFNKATGLPPHQYILREKIRRAQKLLLSGKSAHEVAASLGFSDQSHLHRHFKRIVGVTPRAYVLQFRS